VELSKDSSFTSIAATNACFASPADDYTCATEVSGPSGLDSDTDYYYRLKNSEKQILIANGKEQFKFRTFPKKGSDSEIVVAFGGCSTFKQLNEHAWDSILDINPAAFIWTGRHFHALQHVLT